MKKQLLVLLCILHLLSGCSQAAPYEKPVEFYYCAGSYSYETGTSAIVSETREGADMHSLEETLRAYLAGPESGELVSPFPAGLKLVAIRQEGGTVFITLSKELSQLTNLSLSMACGCITMTCLGLTDAEQVTIEAEDSLLNGQKSITMDRNSLLLADRSAEGK